MLTGIISTEAKIAVVTTVTTTTILGETTTNKAKTGPIGFTGPIGLTDSTGTGRLLINPTTGTNYHIE